MSTSAKSFCYFLNKNLFLFPRPSYPWPYYILVSLLVSNGFRSALLAWKPSGYYVKGHFQIESGNTDTLSLAGRRKKRRREEKRMNNAGDVSDPWVHSVIDIKPQLMAEEVASNYFWMKLSPVRGHSLLSNHSKLTRCLLRQASREPCLHMSAGETQAYQTGSDPI